MKNLKFSLTTVLILTSLFLINCKKDSLKNCEEHQVDSCMEDVNKTNIRIKNDSKYDFCNVLIDPSGKSTNYGIIKKGETTCYRSFDTAYNYAYIKLYIGEKEFVLQPIDYVGEQLLGMGKFTYSIDVADFKEEKISIKSTQD